jgi:ribosome maturation factor RimP
MNMSDEIREQLMALLSPVTDEFDVFLEDVEVRAAGRRTLVRMLVDQADGIELDVVTQISRIASELIEEQEQQLPFGAYVLEVSSPGIDRPLTMPRHFEKNIGRLLTVTDTQGKTHVGRLTEFAEDVLTLDLPKSQVQMALGDVANARVEVEFTPGSGKAAALTDIEGGDVLSEYRNPDQGGRNR